MKKTTYPLKTLFWIAAVGYALLAVATAGFTPALQKFYPLLEDKGAAWYYWQLPEPTRLSRFTMWFGYALHQIVVFTLIFAGIKGKSKKGEARRINLYLLIANILFGFIHLIQTFFWYDGLAQDVPIWTSQGSVIVMLVLVLYMMIPKRGLFWGKAFKTPVHMTKFVRKFHGPFIAWAVVYTFWFHPMEGNWGLMSGFLYMYLLFVQMSLFNTALHFNKIWIVILETMVTVHGTLITVYKHNEIWPMFLFGFLAMFVLTAVHTWKLKSWMKWSILAAYLASIGLVYGLVRGFGHLYEVTFIPTALYGGALGLVLIGWVIDKIWPPRKQAPLGA